MVKENPSDKVSLNDRLSVAAIELPSAVKSLSGGLACFEMDPHAKAASRVCNEMHEGVAPPSTRNGIVFVKELPRPTCRKCLGELLGNCVDMMS